MRLARQIGLFPQVCWCLEKKHLGNHQPCLFWWGHTFCDTWFSDHQLSTVLKTLLLKWINKTTVKLKRVSQIYRNPLLYPYCININPTVYIYIFFSTEPMEPPRAVYFQHFPPGDHSDPWAPQSLRLQKLTCETICGPDDQETTDSKGTQGTNHHHQEHQHHHHHHHQVCDLTFVITIITIMPSPSCHYHRHISPQPIQTSLRIFNKHTTNKSHPYFPLCWLLNRDP